MKLLYVSRDFTTHDHRFVELFTGSGMTVRYCRLENDGISYLRDSLPGGATWVDWAGFPRSKTELDRLGSRFGELLSVEQPNVVHAGPVPSGGLLATVARKAPTIVVSWGSDILADADRDEWSAWSTRTALSGADAFFADNPAVIARAAELAPDLTPRRLCVPWGIEIDAAAAAQADRRTRADSTTVISTRAWHPAYRVPAVIDAFASAHGRVPRLRLVLAGSGPDAPRVRDGITRLGVADSVDLPGMIPEAELRRAFARADVYVSLVPTDGTSISLLDAMYYGSVPVVTRNPGNAAWVEDGVTGFLVDGVDDCAARIADLAADYERARAMAARARAVVEQRANWRTNGRRIIDFYRTVANVGVHV